MVLLLVNMHEKSINCERNIGFYTKSLRRLEPGWNNKFCRRGSSSAQVRRLPDQNVMPTGVACIFCDRCTSLKYVIGGD